MGWGMPDGLPPTAEAVAIPGTEPIKKQVN